jgi:hypothetical protein
MGTTYNRPAGCRPRQPEQIHGYWYSYCDRCGAYHPIISDAQLSLPSNVFSLMSKRAQPQSSARGQKK